MSMESLQDVIIAVGKLRDSGVPPHADKFYHGVFTVETVTKLSLDPIFQHLNQTLPEGVSQEKFLGHFCGITFHRGDEDSITGGVKS